MNTWVLSPQFIFFRNLSSNSPADSHIRAIHSHCQCSIFSPVHPSVSVTIYTTHGIERASRHSSTALPRDWQSVLFQVKNWIKCAVENPLCTFVQQKESSSKAYAWECVSVGQMSQNRFKMKRPLCEVFVWGKYNSKILTVPYSCPNLSHCPSVPIS